MAVPVIGAAIHFLASDTNLIIGSAISDDLRSAIPLKTRWELLGIRTFRQERVVSGVATEPANLCRLSGGVKYRDYLCRPCRHSVETIMLSS
jgi:hypothetical protein